MRALACLCICMCLRVCVCVYVCVRVKRGGGVVFDSESNARAVAAAIRRRCLVHVEVPNPHARVAFIKAFGSDGACDHGPAAYCVATFEAALHHIGFSNLSVGLRRRSVRSKRHEALLGATGAALASASS